MAVASKRQREISKKIMAASVIAAKKAASMKAAAVSHMWHQRIKQAAASSAKENVSVAAGGVKAREMAKAKKKKITWQRNNGVK